MEGQQQQQPRNPRKSAETARNGLTRREGSMRNEPGQIFFGGCRSGRYSTPPERQSLRESRLVARGAVATLGAIPCCFRRFRGFRGCCSKKTGPEGPAPLSCQRRQRPASLALGGLASPDPLPCHVTSVGCRYVCLWMYVTVAMQRTVNRMTPAATPQPPLVSAGT